MHTIADTRYPIHFFTEARAQELAKLNGGEAEGFRVVTIPRRTFASYAIEVFDTDDGMHLGYL